ncbi:NUDIX hydrolase [Streptomyces marokkonensis]|uniref:NUDIX hydrolase n=1 Tax=Streptomyces marokkonensis TaxID=324855 RepID=A0ABW6Q1G1_9ACTN
MEASDRPAARVFCPDAAHRVLLLRRRDPFDGTCLREPPGGGIEPGETAPWCRTVPGGPGPLEEEAALRTGARAHRDSPRPAPVG